MQRHRAIELFPNFVTGGRQELIVLNVLSHDAPKLDHVSLRFRLEL